MNTLYPKLQVLNIDPNKTDVKVLLDESSFILFCFNKQISKNKACVYTNVISTYGLNRHLEFIDKISHILHSNTTINHPDEQVVLEMVNEYISSVLRLLHIYIIGYKKITRGNINDFLERRESYTTWSQSQNI